VPASRRDSIAEPSPVQETLDESLEEADRKAALRKRSADRVRERRPLPIDLKAAEEVRRTGWSRPL
jgi:hypothetical protein